MIGPVHPSKIETADRFVPTPPPSTATHDIEYTSHPNPAPILNERASERLYLSLSTAALDIHSALSSSLSSLHRAAMPFITSVTLFREKSTTSSHRQPKKSDTSKTARQSAKRQQNERARGGGVWLDQIDSMHRQIKPRKEEETEPEEGERRYYCC